MGCTQQQGICILVVVFFITFGVGGFMIVMGMGSGLSIFGGILLAIGFIGFAGSGIAMAMCRRRAGFAGVNRQVIVTGQPQHQGMVISGQVPPPGIQYPTGPSQPPPANTYTGTQYGMGTTSYGPSYQGNQAPMQYCMASAGQATYIPPQGGQQPVVGGTQGPNTYGEYGQPQYGAQFTQPSAPVPTVNDTGAPPPSYSDVVDPNYGVKH